MQIFTLTIAEWAIIVGLVLGVIGAFYQIKNSVASTSEGLKKYVEITDKRLLQLELDARANIANMNSVSASLQAIQAQLNSLSTRVDSLITQLISKDR